MTFINCPQSIHWEQFYTKRNEKCYIVSDVEACGLNVLMHVQKRRYLTDHDMLLLIPDMIIENQLKYSPNLESLQIVVSTSWIKNRGAMEIIFFREFSDSLTNFFSKSSPSDI